MRANKSLINYQIQSSNAEKKTKNSQVGDIWRILSLNSRRHLINLTLLSRSKGIARNIAWRHCTRHQLGPRATLSEKCAASESHALKSKCFSSRNKWYPWLKVLLDIAFAPSARRKHTTPESVLKQLASAKVAPLNLSILFW